jgi:flagellar M-ring protein FliF
MNEFWTGLSKQARIGLVSGIALILVLLVITAWYVLRVEYQVLFADLKPQDAQAMTAELDRLKIPYKLGDSGTAILVDQATVHNTRIKLMGKDFPLHGAVGFELFNNTDFGMTEFAQKINYQRALQGEITRTILGLAEVQDARVHLALPEQGLFKQATSRAKAAIHLTLRQGHLLRQEQITGIQRLVAAAVPSMAVQDVTIVDNRGVALTRVAGTEGETDNSQRLDLKRDTETHLSRKAGAVLDRVFGPGQAWSAST